jgi:hypothetical protein
VATFSDSEPGSSQLAKETSTTVMYGSYGSYSSMCELQMSAPLDISSNRSRSVTDSSFASSTCAFPSWPRRSSLSESESDDQAPPQRASSYLSDEDLFFPASPGQVDDDALSVSSSAGSASPPNEEELLERRREREAYQRTVVRFLLDEKERRRAAAKAQRSGATARRGSMRKSPKGSKLANMTPIVETRGE